MIPKIITRTILFKKKKKIRALLPFLESPDCVKPQREGAVGACHSRRARREHLTRSLVPSFQEALAEQQQILIFSWELGGEDRGGGAKHFCSRMQMD